MSLTSYRAAPSRDGLLRCRFCGGAACPQVRSADGLVYRDRFRERGSFLSRFGGDLLSHVLRRSTIGAVALNGRVRDGIGCFAHAVTTKPGKKRGTRFFPAPAQAGAPRVRVDPSGFEDTFRHQFFVPSPFGAFDDRVSQGSCRPCCYRIKSSLSGN
jgi:hypothetical protein